MRASPAGAQKALASLITMLNSGINVIAAVVLPQEVNEGDQARIAEIVARLFQATGIDAEALRRLSRADALDVTKNPALQRLFGGAKEK